MIWLLARERPNYWVAGASVVKMHVPCHNGHPTQVGGLCSA